MSENPLTIVATDGVKPEPKKITTKATKRITAKSKFDRLYLTHPEQFDPKLNCFGRLRIKRTKTLLNDVLQNAKLACDLGTGCGVFAIYLAEHGLSVDALDIATIPLQNLTGKENITSYQDYIPHTTLESDDYDIVLGLDLIAYLNRDEYRLFMAELARLVKLEGFVLVSTPVDIDSTDALQNFADLVESEFNIEKCHFSYHSYMIRLCRFFEAPNGFVQASKDLSFYESELKKRFSINQTLYKFNSSKPIVYFWSCVQYITNPILKFLKQNEWLTLKMEKLCKFFSHETGISHAIILGQKRKLFEEISSERLPIERKGKREVWE